ncbi:HEAT repeat domain-containing protein [Aerosakkonemataceae cyanobacterium BLCC-F154]|uniref:HEAT repeat domain-containing protein n=1 Tax=Floridaenema fluviatile BLCC-F154 TaxID=3153640 RepID=A0ABV4YIY4_9CYAN
MTTTYATEPINSAESAIAALTGDDNQTRYYAAWWLGKHKVQSACPFLCAALRDERYRTEQGGYPLRRQAARALGQLKNPEVLPDLVIALDCEDLNLREAVVQAIAAIGDKQAIPALINLLRSNSEQPFEAIIEALGTLEAWSVRDLVEPFLQDKSERVQCAAARYLYLLTQEPQYLEKLIHNLNHDNMYLRWAAAFDLGAIGHLTAAEAIISAKVADSLKLLNLRRILEALLADEAENGTSGEGKSFLLGAIDRLLLPENREVSVVRGEAIASLIDKLYYNHPAISAIAVESLVQIGNETVEPLIKAFLKCKDHGIQGFIIQVLARIGDIRALDLLIEVVGIEVANHCQGNVRRMAARGLGKIGRTTNDISAIDRCIEKLNWALSNVEDWALRYAAIVSLEEIATPETQAILTEALAQQGDRIVKLRCQTALENWQSAKIKIKI